MVGSCVVERRSSCTRFNGEDGQSLSGSMGTEGLRVKGIFFYFIELNRLTAIGSIVDGALYFSMHIRVIENIFFIDG